MVDRAEQGEREMEDEGAPPPPEPMPSPPQEPSEPEQPTDDLVHTRKHVRQFRKD